MADGDRTPGLGAFLVLVLVVTSSFVIVFQQTLPEGVATTLSWVVIGGSGFTSPSGTHGRLLVVGVGSAGSVRSASPSPSK